MTYTINAGWVAGGLVLFYFLALEIGFWAGRYNARKQLSDYREALVYVRDTYLGSYSEGAMIKAAEVLRKWKNA